MLRQRHKETIGNACAERCAVMLLTAVVQEMHTDCDGCVLSVPEFKAVCTCSGRDASGSVQSLASVFFFFTVELPTAQKIADRSVKHSMRGNPSLMPGFFAA